MTQIEVNAPRVVAMVGAFDRMNYGDLLFPLIFRRVIASGCDEEFCFRAYGSIVSDLSAFGGMKTQSTKQLLEERSFPKDSLVVLVGGEILTQRWTSTTAYIFGSSRYRRVARKMLGKVWLEKLLRWRFGPKLLQPFIVAPNHFSSPVKTVYCSVGGVGIDRISGALKENVEQCLSRACYVSFRDKQTYTDLSGKLGVVQPFLAPDIATQISKVYPRDDLINLISDEGFEGFHFLKKRKYLCFQCSLRQGSEHADIIAAQLNRLQKEHNLVCVLLPIGRAFGHDDQIFLRSVQERLHGPSFLPEHNTVFDTMSLIANAGVFIGSSLHGYITAAMYQVPRVLISNGNDKLSAYVRTWSNYDIDQLCPAQSFFAKVHDCLGRDDCNLANVAREMLAASEYCLPGLLAAFKRGNTLPV